jgi:hypothetical protein
LELPEAGQLILQRALSLPGSGGMIYGLEESDGVRALARELGEAADAR